MILIQTIMKVRNIMGQILVTTQDQVSGFEITHTLGLVRGNTVRARNAVRDFTAGVKTIFGGEIGEYTRLLTEAREQALQRMLEQAEDRGADAIVATRFETSNVLQGVAELYVYGTAVKLRKS